MENMANWTKAPDATPTNGVRKRSFRCLACNLPVEEPLSALGSLRCLVCREAQAPLDPALVREWQARGASF